MPPKLLLRHRASGATVDANKAEKVNAIAAAKEEKDDKDDKIVNGFR
jgi:hypothetical protein